MGDSVTRVKHVSLDYLFAQRKHTSIIHVYVNLDMSCTINDSIVMLEHTALKHELAFELYHNKSSCGQVCICSIIAVANIQ